MFLKEKFSYDVNQSSPVQTDYRRVVNFDESGNEFISFVPVDYPSFQKSHGTVIDWSLDSLLKAGIDPSFSIHTGLNTRLDGLAALGVFAAAADDVLNDVNSDKS